LRDRAPALERAGLLDPDAGLGGGLLEADLPGAGEELLAALPGRRLAALAARVGGHALAHLVERWGMRLAVREGREQVDRVRALDQVAHPALADRERGLGDARPPPPHRTAGLPPART